VGSAAGGRAPGRAGRTLNYCGPNPFDITPTDVTVLAPPAPGTRVRVAWACAAAESVRINVRKAKTLKGTRMLTMYA